jgi:hypothetical protein
MQPLRRLVYSLVVAACGCLVGPLNTPAAPLQQNEHRPGDPALADASPDPSLARRFAAVVLTEREVSGDFALFARTGNVTTASGNAPYYSVTFLATALPASALPGTLVSVYNNVVQVRNPAASLEHLLDLVTADWGRTADVPGLALGEESRAAVTAPPGTAPAPQVSSVGIVFRRQDMVATLAVSAVGPRPPIDEAVRLAQLVDARLGDSGP